MNQNNNNMETTMTGSQKVIFKTTVKFFMEHHGMTEEQAIQKGLEKIEQVKKMAKSLRHERFQS